MVEFTTHNYLLFSRKEVWFYNGELLRPATYTVFSAAKKVHPSHNRFLEKYHTSAVDLQKKEEDLFGAIHATYRYDIRVAEKQDLRTVTYLNLSKMDCLTLVEEYNQFAREKNLEFMQPEWALAIRGKRNICFTRVFKNHTLIVTHIYIFDEHTISLSSSFHNIHFKEDKLRSEANKFLHWRDMVFFKAMGFKAYDFGGLNLQKLPGVSKFKMNFGGETVENYRFIKASAFVFNLVALIKKLKK